MHDQQRDPRTHALIGAAMEVHRYLGPGLLERIYAEALNVELTRLGIEHRREVVLPVRYKGQLLPVTYRADLICFDSILVELKAEHGMLPVHHAQVINYLKLAGLQIGVLLNFGRASLEFRRYIHTPTSPASA